MAKFGERDGRGLLHLPFRVSRSGDDQGDHDTLVLLADLTGRELGGDRPQRLRLLVPGRLAERRHQLVDLAAHLTFVFGTGRPYRSRRASNAAYPPSRIV